jgi:hypothetical protein
MPRSRSLTDRGLRPAASASSSWVSLASVVTAVMALPGFPIGAVDAKRIQRTAEAMLEFGMLSQQDATEVERAPWSLP